MDIVSFFIWLNRDVLALPTTVLFLSVALYITIRSRFIQKRALPTFLRMIRYGIYDQSPTSERDNGTMSGFHALFVAMGTSIGTGSIVAPSLAIIAGGPSALLWLIVYLFLGSAIKYTEVTLAIFTRTVSGEDKKVVGGPVQYLAKISPYLSIWYGAIMLLLYFFGWQTVQANTLATIYAHEGVPEWIVGLVLALLLYITLRGGARRIGAIASMLVPFMFVLYVLFAVMILVQDPIRLWQSCVAVFGSSLDLRALAYGLAGGSMLQAMRVGVYRGIFISEAGLGTSSIAHAMADTEDAQYQGILAMYSTIADIILALISGLLVLSSNEVIYNTFRSTIVYEIFKHHVPITGQIVLLVSVSLFVFTTLMGNGFNGMQIFGTFTNFTWLHAYIIGVCAVVFVGAIMPVPLVWEIMDTLLAVAAIPNLIGLVLLTRRYPALYFYLALA